MDASEMESPARPQSTESAWKNFEKAPALLAGASTVLYVLGFLVVTGFLASRGIQDHPLLSARYVMAGGLLLACSLIYYFFVWRKIAIRVGDGVKFHPKFSKFFRAYVTNYFLLDDLFGCMYFAIWLVALFGFVPGAQLFAATSIAVFALDRAIFVWGRRYPRACYLLSGLLLCLAGLAFWITAAIFAPLILEMFFVAWGFTLVSTMVLTSEDWYLRKNRFYAVFYLVLMAIFAAISFGATVYGQLNPRFGGGQPARVKVIFSKDAGPEIRMPVEIASKDVFLISDEKDALTLELGVTAKDKRVFRLDRALIQAIQFEPMIQQDLIADWVNSHLVPKTSEALAPTGQSTTPSKVAH